MDFIDENNITISINTLPMYHYQNSGDTEDMVRGTAPDITLIHSEDSVSIKNWIYEHPVGKYHHDVINYDINYMEAFFPFQTKQRDKMKRTKIALRK
eukprot:10254557-Ditylum_brightwellii.AAC.1